MSARKWTFAIVSLTIFISAITNKVEARSVYVIANTGAWWSDVPIMRAYDIEGGNLIFQTQYECVHSLAISLAIDIDSKFLFVTHEQYQQYPGNVVEIVNGRTMQYADTVTAQGASNLAGIIFDREKQKVYTVDRSTPNLYVYSWNPRIPRLVLDEQVELEGLVDGDIGGAWGLALDEENDRLWVTSNETKVRFYDTNDWSHDPNTDYITVSHSAVGIALDVNNSYVYTGRSQLPPLGTLLSQYDLSANSEDTVDVGSCVVGIAVDQETSLVYVTTFGDDGNTIYPNPPRDRLMIYNSSLVKQSWESGDIGNPAGVCVPSGDVSYKPRFPYLTLVKDDNDVECVYPYNFIDESYLTYRIEYDANGYSGGGAVITDYLPLEVDYHSSDPCGVYDPCVHTVSWDIGGISPSDSNTFEITTEVNYSARPGGTIRNICGIESEEYYSFAVVDTNVCCYGGEIIYVDPDANGLENGTSWIDAYTELQDALTMARQCEAGVKSIWVAAGTYQPTRDAQGMTGYETFELIEDVGLFGHFAGYESSTSQRDFADANNETILDGQIGENYYDAVKYVVSADGIENSIVDGFTIGGSYGSYGAGAYLDNASISIVNCRIKENSNCGIYCNQSTAEVANCLITDSAGDGIYCYRSTVAITNCTVEDNGNRGIHAWATALAIMNSIFSNNSGDGIYVCSNCDLIIAQSLIKGNGGIGLFVYSGCDFVLNRSIVCDNGWDGLELVDNNSVTLTNNWIYRNGRTHQTWRDGVWFYSNNASAPLVRNNTIFGNLGYGIEVGTQQTDPNILNCIIYGNEEGDLEGRTFDVTYSCIEGDYTGTGNIPDDPCFVDADANDFHLAANSSCIDSGDPDFEADANETDIDGNPRVIGDQVDIGADEFWATDFSRDGLVNFVDYAMLAAGWHTEPNDANYNDDFDLEDDDSIDFGDVLVLCEDWLLNAGWWTGPMPLMGGRGGGAMMEGLGLEEMQDSLYGIAAAK